MRIRLREELTRKALEEIGLNQGDIGKVEVIARYFCQWGKLLMALHIQEGTENMEETSDILDFVDAVVVDNKGGFDHELIEVCGPHFQKYVEEVLTHKCT